jgi:hypothetical protein
MISHYKIWTASTASCFFPSCHRQSFPATTPTTSRQPPAYTYTAQRPHGLLYRPDIVQEHVRLQVPNLYSGTMLRGHACAFDT